MKSSGALWRPWIQTGLLLLAVLVLYSGSLSAPLVFDDFAIFTGTETLAKYGHSFFKFDLRWLPYASFGWTVNCFGPELIWLRSGNVLLHAANAIALFFLLRRLFLVTLTESGANHKPLSPSNLSGTALSWFAFFGALMFALHPITVYGVAYLVQRSILMATLFVLLMLLAYLQGLLRGSWRWMLLAALCYFAAVYSKELSVMAPGVALALTFLIRKPSLSLLKLIAPFFILAALTALAALLSYQGILGDIYEPRAGVILEQSSNAKGLSDLHNIHGLSILTQAWLFFKYLGLWLLPNPAWMSVDMREPFAVSFSSWPYTLGVVMFLAYPCIAVWLLLRRGAIGLLGFALLFPWILFLTEGAVIRIQEPFVLYRSYLWMPGLCAALPIMFGWLAPKRAFMLLAVISLLLTPLTLNRLNTFSSTFLLWGDAEKLARNTPDAHGVERIYYLYGTELLRLNRFDEAIAIFSKAIAAYPNDDYVYTNRAAAYFSQRKYPEALLDFTRAISLDPNTARSYYGRALTYSALGNFAAAQEDFKISCRLGLCQ